MNRRPILALALCLGCASLAIFGASAALLMETEGAMVIERTRTVWVPVERLVYVPVPVPPTSTPYTISTYRQAQEAGMVPTTPPTPTPRMGTSGVVLIGE